MLMQEEGIPIIALLQLKYKHQWWCKYHGEGLYNENVQGQAHTCSLDEKK